VVALICFHWNLWTVQCPCSKTPFIVATGRLLEVTLELEAKLLLVLSLIVALAELGASRFLPRCWYVGPTVNHILN
jgi:hypothetical protein